jgi:hypothetical protein
MEGVSSAVVAFVSCTMRLSCLSLTLCASEPASEAAVSRCCQGTVAPRSRARPRASAKTKDCEERGDVTTRAWCWWGHCLLLLRKPKVKIRGRGAESRAEGCRSSRRLMSAARSLEAHGHATLGPAALGHAALGPIARGTAHLGSARLGSVRLGSVRLDSVRLDSVRLDSVRLDSVRLDSVRLDSVRLNSARLDSAPCRATGRGGATPRSAYLTKGPSAPQKS